MILVLAIDPGLNSPGFGVFDAEQCKLLCSGSIQEHTKGQPLPQRINQITCDLDERLKPLLELQPQLMVVIEEPHTFSGRRSRGSRDSNSLLKLCFIVGALIQWGLEKTSYVFTVKVRDYRGQIPKTEAARRMKLKYKKQWRTNDESDAVFLGDWWILNRMKTND